MVRISSTEARSLASGLFVAAGASAGNAATVADHLVQSDEMGIDSHGLNRVTQYVAEIENEQLDPRADPIVTQVSPTHSQVDGGGGFGQVACMAAVRAVQLSAQEYGMGIATVSGVGHTGRLGAYTEPLARQGNVAMAFAAGAKRFHWMSPFGGREGRMSTNPISWAAPSTSDPLVADFSTSTTPEGRVRLWRDTGEPAPPDVIIDADGAPSNDPEDLYADPRGWLLPLGGLRHGHKGYALALLSETMATLLGGDTSASDERGNNLTVLAIKGDPGLAGRVTETIAYMRSAEPINPAHPVLVPGEIEMGNARGRTTIDLSPATWDRLKASAKSLDVAVPVEELA